MDVAHMDVNRFGAQYRSPSFTLKRTLENYQTYYDIRFPGDERAAGRPLRRSPAYGWHEAADAAFGEKSGWERVNFYRSNEASGDRALRPNGWAGNNFSPAIAAEHDATRKRVALFDESSFAKIRVAGPDSAPFLQWVCDNDVARGVGRVTYTQMLNSRGGIEADVTVTRVAPSAFWLVTGTAFGSRDGAWLRRQARAGKYEVDIADITGQYACFALWGPRSRELLQALTPADLGHRSFGFMTSQEISVGDVPVRAQRVTFVGELGWELYTSAEYGMTLWETLWQAGSRHGLLAGGYRAIESLRLEKGYRVWGSDLTGETDPLSAGLDFCVAWDKPGGFLGRDALVRDPGRRPGPAARLPDPGRSQHGGARRRAGAGGRRRRRPGDLRRLRLHGAQVHRLRLPAGGPRGDRDRGRGGHLRRVGARPGCPGPAARPPRGQHPQLSQLPLPDGVRQVGHPLRRLRADLLQGHPARVHALEQGDPGAEQHG